MIENHEEITAELTADELAIVPKVLSVLRQHRKGSEIKSGAITSLLWFRFSLDLGVGLLRKIINHIRRNGVEAVCASSKGYYVAIDRKDVESQVRSLRDRAAAISAAADGLEKFAPPVSMQKTVKEFVASVWPDKDGYKKYSESIREIIREGVSEFGYTATADAASDAFCRALYGGGRSVAGLDIMTIDEVAQVLGALVRQSGAGLTESEREREILGTFTREEPTRFLPPDPDELAAVIAQDIKRAEAQNA